MVCAALSVNATLSPISKACDFLSARHHHFVRSNDGEMNRQDRGGNEFGDICREEVRIDESRRFNASISIR
jgi:hypothetical protein